MSKNLVFCFLVILSISIHVALPAFFIFLIEFRKIRSQIKIISYKKINEKLDETKIYITFIRID